MCEVACIGQSLVRARAAPRYHLYRQRELSPQLLRVSRLMQLLACSSSAGFLQHAARGGGTRRHLCAGAPPAREAARADAEEAGDAAAQAARHPAECALRAGRDARRDELDGPPVGEAAVLEDRLRPGVELAEGAHARLDHGEHRLPVLRLEAGGCLGVEGAERADGALQRALARVRALAVDERDDADAVELRSARHLLEGEELDHAPEPRGPRRAREDDQLGAAGEEDGQAGEALRQLVLVDAGTVEPDARRAARLLLKVARPAAEGVPLCGGGVVPRVREEGVAHPELRLVRVALHLARPREVEVGRAQLVEGDDAEVLLGRGEQLRGGELGVRAEPGDHGRAPLLRRRAESRHPREGRPARAGRRDGRPEEGTDRVGDDWDAVGVLEEVGGGGEGPPVGHQLLVQQRRQREVD
mmetsp:Transcript_10073/g.31828  ORF Transcript_10073/g.31828 Transcript_10073/m.31828 type:complete len:416 (+) Transcript_10073:3-1250(+)